jgi:MFS family permease
VAAAHAHSRLIEESTLEYADSIRRFLLTCGIAGAALYPIADIFASTRYPGFSYRDQAVSELFAIGAPTSGLVVPLFSVSSALLFLFGVGLWMSAQGRRWVRPLAVMMALNAIDALLLWNFFPMHMRGEEPTFTDKMHGLLAIDPFLLAAVILGAVAFRGWFRAYTVINIVLTSILAFAGLSYISAVIANEPTPWMGAIERASQYATNVWYAVLAVMLLRLRPESRNRPLAVE